MSAKQANPFVAFWDRQSRLVAGGVIVATLVAGGVMTVLNVPIAFSIGLSVIFACLEFFLFHAITSLTEVIKALDVIVSNNPVSYEQHSRLAIPEICKRYRGKSKIEILYGLSDLTLLYRLVKSRGGSDTIVYFAPGCVDKFDPRTLNAKAKLFLADVPEFSVIILVYSNQGNCEQCDILRPRINERSLFYLTSIYPNEDVLWHFRMESFREFTRHRTSLDSKYLASAAYKVAKWYKKHINLLCKHRELPRSSQFYYHDHLIALMGLADESFFALDFLEPSIWLENKWRRKYLQAHKSRAPEKIRIHVYKSKAFVLKHWHQYEQFLDEMCLYGVELYLISLERFNQLGNMPLNGGGIVFDDTCLVLLHNQLDDLPGKDVGTFVFVTEQVIKYKEQLWELKSHAMSPDQFRAIILSSDNRKRSKMLVSEETQ